MTRHEEAVIAASLKVILGDLAIYFRAAGKNDEVQLIKDFEVEAQHSTWPELCEAIMAEAGA